MALGGEAIGLVAGAKPGPSEGIGILAAIIIMLLAFGSVVAMGLPIVTALFGIAVAFAVLDLLTHVVTTPIFAPEIMAMIGLGVGIDYALFVVTRFRQGLAEGRTRARRWGCRWPRRAGPSSSPGPRSSCRCSASSCCSSRSCAGSPSAPSPRWCWSCWPPPRCCRPCSGFAGRAIDNLAIKRLLQSGAEPDQRGFWYRWSRSIQRHPVVFMVSSVLVLLCLALPMFSMRQAFTDAGNDPASTTTRQAFDALATGFGPGFNGPLIIVADVPAGQQATVERLDAAVRSTPGVAFVSPAQVSTSGNAAVLVAYPTTAPQAAQTEALVHTLRDRVIPEVTAGTGVQAYVGGETAGSVDAATYLSNRLPWVIGTVLLLSFLLLMAVFRSVAIPRQGGHREPAVGGRLLRRDRGRLPVGLAGRLLRHRGHQPDRPVDPADDVHHPLRPVHGLRGLPPVAHP